MKKNKKDSRRQFLKNTSLSILSVAAFPTILKSVSSAIPLSICDQSTEDAFGQGPFYTTNAPSIQNNQLEFENSQKVGTSEKLPLNIIKFKICKKNG